MKYFHRTGRTRHRVQRIGGLFRRKEVLVLQCEVSGLVTSWTGPLLNTEHKTIWVDAKPEWIMEEPR